ncbi:ORF3 protein [Armillaria borealis mycovirgavirus 1]|nr:ORF3 protein [Armillaria borealis mycovirgavirus 1]
MQNLFSRERPALDKNTNIQKILPLVIKKNLTFSQPPPLTLIDIERSSASATVSASIGRSTRSQFIVRGATGSGKSTWALVPLFAARSRVVTITPFPALVGNWLYDWNTMIKRTWPTIQEFAYIWPSLYSGSVVCTPKMFIEDVVDSGSLPTCSYIIFDEYSSPDKWSTIAYHMLRTMPSSSKVVFISATPLKATAAKQTALTTYKILELPIPDIFSLTTTKFTVFDKRYLFSFGPGGAMIVVPTMTHVNAMMRIYPEAVCVDHNQTVEQARDSHKLEGQQIYVVLQLLAIGITYPVSVMIIYNTTAGVKFIDGVYSYVESPMDAYTAQQVAGRGNRVYKTTIIMPSLQQSTTYDRSMLEWDSATFLTALGCDFKYLPVKSTARLQSLSITAARRAVAYDYLNPYMSAYLLSPNGIPYDFAGGNATTFLTDYSADLRIFTINKKFFVAPFVNFLSAVDPTVMVPIARQNDAITAVISKSGLSPPSDRDELVRLFDKHFDSLIDKFVDIITHLATNDNSKLVVYLTYEAKHATMSDDELKKEMNWTLRSVYGDLIADVIEVCKKHKAYTRNNSFDWDVPYTEKDGTLSSKTTMTMNLRITGKSRSSQFSVGLSELTKSDGYIDSTKTDQWLTKQLQSLLITIWIVDSHPEATVSLSEKKHEAFLSGCSWLQKYL